MPHKIDLIMDFQFGSTGKGLLAGYLAKRGEYDTAMCAFSTNAGHTYKDAVRGVNVMTQQLPTAITSPSVKTIMIGPGAAIHRETFLAEVQAYSKFLEGKKILIHPHAVDVSEQNVSDEREFTKIGSTAKGVGRAYIQRIERKPQANPTVAEAWMFKPGWEYVCDNHFLQPDQWNEALDRAENVIIEGAQGFSLSMYHGFYPYTTSRDVTPAQIMADCGAPFKWAPYIQVNGTLRTYPIRVNNRDGSSGPGYMDQDEISWESIGVEPELTTVTKLPRRLFSFSHQQLELALRLCGGYWKTNLFLNFANYFGNDRSKLEAMIKAIETPNEQKLNAPRVEWIGFGPDDAQVLTRHQWADMVEEAESEGAID